MNLPPTRLKYGAVASSMSALECKLKSVERPHLERRLLLRWQERVEASGNDAAWSGFGTKLIEMNIAARVEWKDLTRLHRYRIGDRDRCSARQGVRAEFAESR